MIKDQEEKCLRRKIEMGRLWSFEKVVLAKSPKRKWWYARKLVFPSKELADTQVRLFKEEGHRAWVEGHTVYVK